MIRAPAGASGAKEPVANSNQANGDRQSHEGQKATRPEDRRQLGFSRRRRSSIRMEAGLVARAVLVLRRVAAARSFAGLTLLPVTKCKPPLKTLSYQGGTVNSTQGLTSGLFFGVINKTNREKNRPFSGPTPRPEVPVGGCEPQKIVGAFYNKSTRMSRRIPFADTFVSLNNVRPTSIHSP